VPRVASKDQQTGGKYNLSANGPLQTFCSFLCLSLPTRGTPRLYEIQRTAFVQKCNFLGLPAHRNAFVDGTFKKNLPMNVPKHLLKHVPLPYLCSVKQKKTAMIKYIVRNKKNPKDKTKSASACSSHPAPPWRPPSKSSTTPTSNSSSLRWCKRKPTVETRRAACRQQTSTGKGEIQSFSKWAFAKFFDSFWRLSLPTRGTPRLYEIQGAARPVCTENQSLPII